MIKFKFKLSRDKFKINVAIFRKVLALLKVSDSLVPVRAGGGGVRVPLYLGHS